MTRLEVRVGGITRTAFERAHSQLRGDNVLGGTRIGEWLRGTPLGSRILALSPAGLAATAIVVVVGVAYISTPVAIVNNVPVVARHVLVLADEALDPQPQIAALTGAGIEVDRGAAINLRPRGLAGLIAGVGALIAGSDLSSSIRRELPQHPGVDAIYVYSAFSAPDDRALRQQLQALVRDNDVRLYLSTTGQSPSSELLAIATASGGGLISPVRP